MATDIITNLTKEDTGTYYIWENEVKEIVNYFAEIYGIKVSISEKEYLGLVNILKKI